MVGIVDDFDAMFGMAEARRDRAAARRDDRRRRMQASAGDRLPTVAELLRGFPLRGNDIATDMRCFVASAADGAVDPKAPGSLPVLLAELDEFERGGCCDSAGLLGALSACAASTGVRHEVGMRCVIYAALLGDVGSGYVVAGEAALLAHQQEWHREGDGTEAVWQAIAWSVACAVRAAPGRALRYPIGRVEPLADRIDAFADEFRTRVSRTVAELDRCDDNQSP